MEAYIYAILDGEICIILLAELSSNSLQELVINMNEKLTTDYPRQLNVLA